MSSTSLRPTHAVTPRQVRKLADRIEARVESVGVHEGLARERSAFLRRRYARLPNEVIQAESERQASLVLGLSLRNRDLLKEIILREQIDCDFAPRGWLHACERLLGSREPVALKFLAVLNHGLIATLRAEDCQLMRLNTTIGESATIVIPVRGKK